MPGRTLSTVWSDSLFADVSAQLPLFEDLPPDTIDRLSASGFGRGLLTASLRARLRKAGYRDLGHLAQSAPEAIARIRKFGPIRVDRVRTFILDEIARWLPEGRARHGTEATGARRLGRLRAIPVGRLPLEADQIAALRLGGESCAALAIRSRRELLGSGFVTSSDLDRIVATLATILRPPAPPSAEVARDAPESDGEALAARRAARLAEQDREWDEAAPAGGRDRAGTV